MASQPRTPSRIFLLHSTHSDMDLFAGREEKQYWHSRSHVRGSWGEIVRNLRRLRLQPPDLAVVSYRENPFFRTGTSPFSGSIRLLRTAVREPDAIGQLLVFAALVRRGVPIALVNRSDVGALPAGSAWFYRHCHACFIRELPLQAAEALRHLGAPSSAGGVDPGKLRPISLGISSAWLEKIPGGTRQPRLWDVFFSGDLAAKPDRARLVEELQLACRRHGWKLLLRDSLRPEEYWRALAQSRLCLSPPGRGWDCWRHYESMLAGSVPLMTHPTIRTYHAPQDGKQAFYFSPEPGGLEQSLLRAMQAPQNLPAMSAEGQKLVLARHELERLRQYIFEETLRAHRLGKGRAA